MKKMLLKVLVRKGTISEEVQSRIHGETEVSILEKWIDAALDVASVEEFIEKM